MKALRDIFWKSVQTRHGSSKGNQNIFCNAHGYDPVVYAFRYPPFQQLEFDAINHFSGWMFYFGNKAIKDLNTYADDGLLGCFPVHLPSEELVHYVPHIPSAKACGFEFDLYIEASWKKLSFEIIFDDGTKEFFCEYDLSDILSKKDEFDRLRLKLNEIDTPEPEIVFLTQGLHDVQAYQNSIIPCILNMKQYLSFSNIDHRQIHSVLDFGCGTGRFLIGWHIANPDMELYGCDINDKLISWGKEHLPDNIRLAQSSLEPPLPYKDQSFKFIYLISVFTHLSLHSQKRWIDEFRRLLKPGGCILVTLHGELYARNSFFKDMKKLEVFLDHGYFEMATQDEGSNIYGTFHSYEFVKQLFNDFEIVGYYPNGRINRQRMLFQIAQSQDVYVLK